jgi:aminomethyltransferase
LPSLASYIVRRVYPSGNETTEFLPHPRKMASKKAVFAMRPVFNGLVPRIWRAECSQVANYSTRTSATPAPRPRKLTRLSQRQVRYASSEAANEKLGRTGLYELHSKYGAKFVPFGGYAMPVQYSDMSIIDSHNWTREKASLFDVGHM